MCIRQFQSNYNRFLSSGKELLYLGLSVGRSVGLLVEKIQNHVMTKSVKIKIVGMDK